MKNLNAIDVLSLILVVIGGINWGLIGLFKINLVTAIFESTPVLVTVIYVLIGLSAVYVAGTSMKLTKK